MWQIIITGPARKHLKRLPKSEKIRVFSVLEGFKQGPFVGDITKLAANKWRRRIGNYRIIFSIDHKAGLIYIFGAKRRTTTTY